MEQKVVCLYPIAIAVRKDLTKDGVMKQFAGKIWQIIAVRLRK